MKKVFKVIVEGTAYETFSVNVKAVVLIVSAAERMVTADGVEMQFDGALIAVENNGIEMYRNPNYVCPE